MKRSESLLNADRRPNIHTFGEDWDRRFLGLASNIAAWSKDRSTKVGCVIVGPDREIRSTGYNGFPRGVDDDRDERHERPQKYSYAEHSERNAIYNAARMGLSLRECTLYFWSAQQGFPPCADCSRAIIQSGITRVVGKTGDDDPLLWRKDWAASMAVSIEMLKEAGIVFGTVSLSSSCVVPPDGWSCTRSAGHEGPCAAVSL